MGDWSTDPWMKQRSTWRATITDIREAGRVLRDLSDAASDPDLREEALNRAAVLEARMDQAQALLGNDRTLRNALKRAAAVDGAAERAVDDTAGTGAPTQAPRLPHENADDLLTRMVETPQYDLEGVIAAGQIVTLGGFTGSGKTPLVARLSDALLAGRPIFAGIPHGRPLPEGYKIVWLTQESEYTFKPMLEQAGLTTAVTAGRLEIVYLHAAYEAGLTWPEIVEEAAAMLGTRGLLIVDPLGDWAMVKSEDDNAIMAEAFKPLLGPVARGLSALVVAHAWKSFDAVPDDEADVMHVRGAGAIVSNASIVLLYKKPKNKELGENVRFLKVGRNRISAPLEPRYLRLEDDNTLQPLNALQGALGAVVKQQEKILTVLAYAGAAGIKNSDLSDQTGISRNALPGLLGALEDAGKILSTGTKQSNKDPYTWHIVEEG